MPSVAKPQSSASRGFRQLGLDVVALAALGLAALGAGVAALLLRMRAPSTDCQPDLQNDDASAHGAPDPQNEHLRFACFAVSTDREHYCTLNVEPTASTKEIKKAYRELARCMHPDVNSDPDAVQQFKRLNQAYAVLSDEKKRSIYDETGQSPTVSTEAPVEPSGPWILVLAEIVVVASVGLAVGVGYGLGVASGFYRPKRRQIPPPNREERGVALNST